MTTTPRPSLHEARIPGLAPKPDGDDASAPRKLFYARLARVSVRHEHYAATGGACHDFSARPTRYTAWLLGRLGLLFREEEDGFSVLYNQLQKEALLAYVRSKAEFSLTPPRPWARLCFVLSLRNPWFVNFTDLPVDTNPTRWNLYLTNRQAHAGDGGTVLLSAGRWVSGVERVPVTGPVLAEPVGGDVASVRLRSVSGREVMCRPRCTPAGEPSSSPGRAACAERLYFDLGDLPEEMYQVETVMSDGAVHARSLLYTAAYPVSLAFVELLLADPAGPGAPAGVYPVRALDTDTPKVDCVPYEIAFAARRTWWSYYVVGEAPGGEGGELRIRQVRAAGEPRVAFLGPCRVALPGGRQAWRFVSRRPIALAQRLALHLQLVWRREGSRRVDVLMDRLPLADGRQLVQTHPGAEAPPPAGDDGGRGARCRRLQAWLSAPDLSPPGAQPRLFSDIYVHV